ncbi:MAG: SUMF1/EgtB/PvdO family nonheme iron enzyme [Spirochaetales bacterium]|nr:SUMF1/EgtB/PvdO family nonheme iron enzyme [Spirochaetales bacterium]
MKMKGIAFFTLAMPLLVLFSCHDFNSPIDPASDNYNGIVSDDGDGDGIPRWRDVDEIGLIAPGNGALLSATPPTLSVYKFDTRIINTYWIQISSSDTDFSGNIVYEKNDCSSNVCSVPGGTLSLHQFYYWRAKAYDGVKWSDDWSPVFGFIADPPVTETTGNVDFNLAHVTPGSYYVGVNPPGADNVTLTRGYWLANTEVTYELWYDIRTWANANGFNIGAGSEGFNSTLGAAPTTRKLEPVLAHWRDCIVWCNALSQKLGYTPIYYSDAGFSNPITVQSSTCDDAFINWDATGFRLPSEAEWEVAARGGNVAKLKGTYGYTYSGSDNIDDVAWWNGNCESLDSPVGMLHPNQLGIFDMSGNVQEWCWDRYRVTYPSSGIDPAGAITGSDRIVRGGFFIHLESMCTVFNRSCHLSVVNAGGFRFLRKE